MRRLRLAGPQRVRFENKWHYEDEFCRPICKRHGSGALLTPKPEQVTCRECLRVLKEKGIIKDDEVAYTVS